MSLGLGLTKSWEGQMRRSMSAALQAARIAQRNGVDLTAQQLQEAMRAQIRSAGLGDKVANALRRVTYPKTGGSLNAAGSVFSKAPHIMAGFTLGGEIKNINGKPYLLIPTGFARIAARGRRITLAAAIKRFGKPWWVPLPKGGFLLTFATRDVNGKLRRKRKKDVVAKEDRVPLFTAKPMVRLAKRLNPETAIAEVVPRFQTNIAAAWPNEISPL